MGGGINNATGRGDWGQFDLGNGAVSKGYGRASDAGSYAEFGGTEDQYNALTKDQWSTFQGLKDDLTSKYNANGQNYGAADVVAAKKALTDFVAKPFTKTPDPGAPGSPVPDLTDAALGQSRKTQLLRMLQGQGRASTFLTGPSGAGGTPSLGTKTLLGG